MDVPRRPGVDLPVLATSAMCGLTVCLTGGSTEQALISLSTATPGRTSRPA